MAKRDVLDAAQATIVMLECNKIMERTAGVDTSVNLDSLIWLLDKMKNMIQHSRELDQKRGILEAVTLKSRDINPTTYELLGRAFMWDLLDDENGQGWLDMSSFDYPDSLEDMLTRYNEFKEGEDNAQCEVIKQGTT